RIGAGECRRDLDNWRQGRPREGSCRRRRRERVVGDPGRRDAEDQMVERIAAVPGNGRDLRPHPQGEGGRAAGPGPRRTGRAGAARVIEAEYEWRLQSHASMGPACAVVDAKADEATLWTGSQKPHFARDGVARILGLKPEQVRGIWVPGPGSYGRNDAGDAAA